MVGLDRGAHPARGQLEAASQQVAGLEGGILRGQLEAASQHVDLRQLDRGGIGLELG